MSLTKHCETLVFDQILNTTPGASTGVMMRPIIYPNINVGADHIAPVPIPAAQADVQQDFQEDVEILADATANNSNLYKKKLAEEKHKEQANKNVDDLYEQEERNIMVIEAINDELEGIL
jgi:DNA repair photolyase